MMQIYQLYTNCAPIVVHQLSGSMVTSELLWYKEPSVPDKTPEIGNLKIRMQALFFLKNHNLQLFFGIRSESNQDEL